MLQRNNSSKLIRHFCFKNEKAFIKNQRNYNDIENRNESVLFAGTAGLSHTNDINCYAISEASNEVKLTSKMCYPTYDVSIDSIYQINNIRYAVLLRSYQEDKIFTCTFDPSKNLLQQDPKPIVEHKYANSKISFFFPMPDQSNSLCQIVYVIGDKIYKFLNSTQEIRLPINNCSIKCGTYVDSNVLAIGVESSLLLYDIREENSRMNCVKHNGPISAISSNRIDKNILYTGGYDGIVKQIDIRNWTDTKENIKSVYEVCAGPAYLPQCPVIHIAPNPIDKSVFATAASGNIFNGYVRVFKDGVMRYYSKSTEPLKSKKNQEEVLISATTQNLVTWIDWSTTDPSLLVSVDMDGEFRTHYFTDLDFDGLLSGI